MAKKKTQSKEAQAETISNENEDLSFQSDKGWIVFAVIILVIVLLVLSFVGYQRFTESQVVSEIDFLEVYENTRNGDESENNFLYGEFVFVNVSNLWQTLLIETRIKGNTSEKRDIFLTTHYNPRQLEDIDISSQAVEVIRNASMVYMTYPSNLDQDFVLAGVEIGKVLGTKNGILNKPVSQAVYGNYSGSYPIITCDNATASEVVILFEEGNTTSISESDFCITISGETPRDIVRAADRFVFSTLEIMP